MVKAILFAGDKRENNPSLVGGRTWDIRSRDIVCYQSVREKGLLL